jgi:hypothetical protein
VLSLSQRDVGSCDLSLRLNGGREIDSEPARTVQEITRSRNCLTINLCQVTKRRVNMRTGRVRQQDRY